MDGRDVLADAFETHRAYLQAVAYRMLGSRSEAEDAVQEVWLRLSGADFGSVRNLRGWLTTVVGRICVDMLRSRTARREDAMEDPGGALDPQAGQATGPEEEALLADSVGEALLMVLNTLTPDERLAFVLHDIFGVPFKEIGPILDRSADAAKMLASRARNRVRTAEPEPRPDDAGRQRAVVRAFLAASRAGEFEELIGLLHPEVAFHADRFAAEMGAPSRLHGASAVVEQLLGRAQAARPAMVDGQAGAAWSTGGRVRVVFVFTVVGGRITAIEAVADPERLASLDLRMLKQQSE